MNTFNFKFINDMQLNYLNEVFQWTTERSRILRKYYSKIKHQFHNVTADENSFFSLGFSI